MDSWMFLYMTGGQAGPSGSLEGWTLEVLFGLFP